MSYYRSQRRPPGLERIAIVNADPVHGGDARKGTLDFSASINPLGPPPAALEAYRSAVDAISSYPPAYPQSLTEAIAEWLTIPANEVIVGNGSTHLIHLFMRTFQPRFPYVAIPTFSEFANALALNNCTPNALELSRSKGFRITLADAQHALKHRASAIFSGRPNSPSGGMTPLGEAERIVRECERFHAFCMFDEAFIDFADPGESAIGLMQAIPVRQRKGLLVLGSLTKIFAIPGLRIGFLAGAPHLIEAMHNQLEPWSVNIVAERVAIACLDHSREFFELTRQWLVPERASLEKNLLSIAGISVFPSAANFLMITVDEEEHDITFDEFMLEKGIAVRDLTTLPGCSSGFYRVAVRKRADNDRLIAAARTYFER
jgi:threonine-phosphate decarboxylase